MVAKNQIRQHVRQVYSLTKRSPIRLPGDGSSTIAQSWLRCLQFHELTPEVPVMPEVIESAKLREVVDSMDDLCQCAHIVGEDLYQSLLQSGFAIFFTDPQGIICNSHLSPENAQQFTKAGLVPGAVWSEATEGTNGIGTAISENAPVTVHGEEHYRTTHLDLTCSGAPVRDPDGNIVGVLDASSVKVVDSPGSQKHTLGLVVASARTIEHCMFLRRNSSSWVLHFHTHPEFVGKSVDGLVAIDGAGGILAANEAARRAFGAATNEPITGRTLSEFFDVTPDAVFNSERRASGSVWPILQAGTGSTYYAMLRAPVQGRSRASNRGIAKPLRLKSVSISACLSLHGLAGGDPQMAYNARLATRVIDKKIPILLYGETGTGKEEFARAAHQASQRAAKPFVAVNCAAIPETLIESELFGYKPGAFTGARREGMRGKVLQSSGGTLFLDEIGDMPPQLQTRLLRVLEEQEVLPLGSDIPIKVDLNIISATHHDLPEAVKHGGFREDLYFRLNGITVNLTPLRDRGDIEHLIACVLELETCGETEVQIEQQAFSRLVSYHWPGNIRELRTVIRTACALCDEGIIRLADLPKEVAFCTGYEAPESQTSADEPLTGNFDGTRTTLLETAEREAILEALKNNRWNFTTTAAGLGMSRNTLYRKAKRHGISRFTTP